MENNNLETLDKFTDYFSKLIERFHETKDRNHLRELSTMIEEMMNFLREEFQKSTKAEAERAIENIRSSNKNISQNDLDVLENYMIGDAKAYLESEKHYASWLSSLDELGASIKHIDTSNASNPQYFLKLLGETKVLKRTLEDLSFYTGERERIESFQKAISDGIQKEEADVFADLLKFKLNNPNH